MPIQPMSRNEYTRIPDNEDVTPVDRNLSRNFKRTEKGVRCIVIVGVVLVIAATLTFFGYHFASSNSSNFISIFTTTKDDYTTNQKSFAPKMTMKLFTAISCPPSSTGEDNDDACFSELSTTESKMIVDNRIKYQQIEGFGGAFTESASINFYSLPDEVQERVLESYFGKSGIGLTLGRVHINSCDFGLSSYNFDVVPNDYDLNFFDLEVTHDTEDMIPFILDASARASQPIRLVASPWSPPPWMKLPGPDGNISMVGSATPNGLKGDPKIQLTWARYLSKFITAYKRKGINIWALTPQNEPEFPAPWEACAYNASFERDFIRDYLGPVIKTDHPDVLILAFDHNKDHLKTWTETILSKDALSADQYVDGMAFHWYGGEDRMTDGTYGYNNLNASYHIAPSKMFISTEGCSCPGVEIGNWLRAERLGHDILFDLLNYAQGWIDWNLIVDHQGGPNHLKNFCDAAMVMNPHQDDVILQPKFFYFGHFSKFFTPSTKRIYSKVVGNFKFQAIDSNVQTGLEVAAFACEHSVRQMWSIHPTENYLFLTTPSTSSTVDGSSVLLCVVYGDQNRSYLRLAACSAPESQSRLVRVLTSQKQIMDRDSQKCFTLADHVREAGALVELHDCVKESDGQSFQFNSSTGEITILSDNTLCLTAGWPFLTGVAGETPTGQIVSVIMNEASEATTVSLFDLARNEYVLLNIPPSSIQTVVY